MIKLMAGWDPADVDWHMENHWYAMSIFVNEPYAYIADGSNGLQIIDISNTSSPTLAGTYEKEGFAMSVFVGEE